VRVETADNWTRTGTLVSQTADTLVIDAPGDPRTPLATSTIRRIRVYEGRSHGRGALQGMGYGAAILGGTLGGLALVGSDPDWVLGWVFVGGVYGSVIGLGVGAIFGAETWTTTYASFPRVTVGPTRGGARGIGLAFTF
jgi:hypothetical protein